MNRYFPLLALLCASACQAPGYDYSARQLPEEAEALAYRDVETGSFAGPGGGVARAEFLLMVDEIMLDGQRWFTVSDQSPQGYYDGQIRIASFDRERQLSLERRCVEYDAPLDCERRAMVERACETDIVRVEIVLTLTDRKSDRRIFSSVRSGEARREDCFDLGEVPDDGRSEGDFGSAERIGLPAYEAPRDLIEGASVKAVRAFRSVIAPYNETFRAEIAHKGISAEEANDSRFAAAVEATRKGEYLQACEQWNALAKSWPSAPATLHNQGACLEAKGDLAGAQDLYAQATQAAEKAGQGKHENAKVLFRSLARVSAQRQAATLLANQGK
jgi:hypothetical protein